MPEVLRQYTGVSIHGRGLLIKGEPGTGKTSLALVLIDRGATLIGDDGVALSVEGDVLIAGPPNATAGLVEIRGVGIAPATCTAAPVALLLQLGTDAMRFREVPDNEALLECTIPKIPFSIAGGMVGLIDAIRAEYALRLYGLQGSPAAEKQEMRIGGGSLHAQMSALGLPDD